MQDKTCKHKKTEKSEKWYKIILEKYIVMNVSSRQDRKRP